MFGWCLASTQLIIHCYLKVFRAWRPGRSLTYFYVKQRMRTRNKNIANIWCHWDVDVVGTFAFGFAFAFAFSDVTPRATGFGATITNGEPFYILCRLNCLHQNFNEPCPFFETKCITINIWHCRLRKQSSFHPAVVLQSWYADEWFLQYHESMGGPSGKQTLNPGSLKAAVYQLR